MPSRDKPQGIGITVWWYTPLGFIHHQLAADEAGTDGGHPANARDLWAHALDLWPELADISPRDLTHGRIVRTEDGWWAVLVRPFTDDESGLPTPEQIRDWFQLPPETRIDRDDW